MSDETNPNEKVDREHIESQESYPEEAKNAEVVSTAYVRVNLLETGHYDLHSYSTKKGKMSDLPVPDQNTLVVSNLLVQLFQIGIALQGNISGLIEYAQRAEGMGQAAQLLLQQNYNEAVKNNQREAAEGVLADSVKLKK